MSYQGEVLADSPAGYWRLGETSGTTAADSSSNALNGTYVNSPTLGVAGAVSGNTAATFNGTTQYVSIPDANPLDVGDVFSLEAWVKITDTSANSMWVVSKKFSTTTGYGMKVTSSAIWLAVGTSLVANSTGVNVSDGSWHHVVVTKNGATRKVYVDGVDRTDPANVTNATGVDNTRILAIGQRGDGVQFYPGSIDEVAVYPTALSLARVQAHYNAINAPTANFTYTTSPLAASFTDTSTPVSPATIASRSWTFGDGGTSTATNPSHTYSSAGTYTVTLTVTDSNGLTGTTSQSVIIPPAAANVPPTAFFTNTTGGLTVAFADASTDPDGTVVAWSWNFGDGATSTLQNPSHTYVAVGTYTVFLTVTDDDGAAGSYSKSITVAVAGDGTAHLSGPIFLRESTLTAGINATQTTIPVAELSYWPPNDAGWPAVNEGMLDPEGTPEKITWTSKSAQSGPGNLTGVVRGAFGTAAGSHSSGVAVGLYGRHDAGLLTKRKIPTLPTNAALTLQALRRHSDSERFVWADFDNLNETARLDVMAGPASSGSISTTLDEGGVAVTRSAAVSTAKEKRNLIIANPPSASGDATITLAGVARGIPLTPGTYEQVQITVNSSASSNDGFTVRYVDAAGVTQISTILSATNGSRASDIAAVIRAGTYSGWVTSGTGATVIFTRTVTGNAPTVAYGGASHAIALADVSWFNYSITTTRQGSAGQATAADVADLIRSTSFPGWVTGGTVGTATVTIEAIEAGPQTGTFSYSAGTTGATSTAGLTQTTAGAQTTPTAVATAIRALYAGNAYWGVGGSGSAVTWAALTSGAKQDATFSDGGTNVIAIMQTVNQGSADIVGYLTDSGGVQQKRRVLGNITTTTEFNIGMAVSGAGTEHGIVTFWGSFATDPLTQLWRVEGVDLTEYMPGEGAYGVISESASGITYDVRTDEVQITNRGLTYYRDHNLRGNLLGQLHYFGLLEPEQAREDLGVQELWHPIMPGQQISLAFYMRYTNLPTSFPSKPLFITFHHEDGTVTELGDASGSSIGLSGDATWSEHTLTFTAPTLETNPVPAYWMQIRSRNMSQGTVLIQEIVPTLGATPKRTPYYAFTGTFRTQLDARTPKETPFLLLERQRTALEAQFEANGGTASAQYRSASDPTLFDSTWYTDAASVPDLPVVDVDMTLSGDGLATPEVPSGYPRMEYRARPGKRHLFLKPDRTEFAGGVIMDQVADWYRKPGTAMTVLPSGHVLKQKLNEPVGYLPSFVLWAFRPETVKYLSENLNTAGTLFYAEVFDELLLLNITTAEPKFQRAILSRFDNEDAGDTSAASRYSFWISGELSAEVVAAQKISE